MNWKRLLLTEVPRDGEGGTGSGGTQVTPAPTPVTPDPVPTATTTPTPVEPPASVEPPPVPAWVNTRISSLTGKAKELEERLQAENSRRAELEAELSRLRGGQAQQGGQSQPSPHLYTEADVQTRASALAKEQSFAEASNKVYFEGQNKYQDFGPSIIQLNNALGGMTREFVEAAIETGQAPEVIYALSKDINKAAEIMSAGSPTKVAAATLKFAQSLTTQAKPVVAGVSNAPAPIQPKIGGKVSAEPSLENENLSTTEWMALRKAQISARQQRR